MKTFVLPRPVSACIYISISCLCNGEQTYDFTDYSMVVFEREKTRAHEQNKTIII